MKNTWKTLKDFAKYFSEDRIMAHSSSIAFYTLFSLPAMLMVIIFISGIFVSGETGEELFKNLKEFMGGKSANQLQASIQAVELNDNSLFNKILGVSILIFSSTSLFGALQEAFNEIWKVESRASQGFFKLVLSRLISLGMVILLGFLLAASLIIDTLIVALGEIIEHRLDFSSQTTILLINEIMSFALLTLIFASIFKILPDAKIKWRNCWVGAIFTSVMFLIGKFAIAYYLGKSSISTTYGAAGSLVIVLLWVYYLTIIALIGAVFTKMFALKMGDEVEPKKFAVNVTTHLIETKESQLETNSEDEP